MGLVASRIKNYRMRELELTALPPASGEGQDAGDRIDASSQ